METTERAPHPWEERGMSPEDRAAAILPHDLTIGNLQAGGMIAQAIRAAVGEEERVHAWLGWMTEYPEDGFVIVDAASWESARTQVHRQMNGEATGDDAGEVSVRPLIAKHVYQMVHDSHAEGEPSPKGGAA